MSVSDHLSVKKWRESASFTSVTSGIFKTGIKAISTFCTHVRHIFWQSVWCCWSRVVLFIPDIILKHLKIDHQHVVYFIVVLFSFLLFIINSFHHRIVKKFCSDTPVCSHSFWLISCTKKENTVLAGKAQKVILCKKMFGAFAEMGTAHGFVILWLVAVKYLYWWCLGSEVCRLFILGHYENYFRRIHCGKTLWQALNCVGPLIKVMRYLS